MTRKSHIFCLTMIIIWTGFACSVPSEAAGTDTIAVSLSTDAPPFDKVLEGFRDYLQQKNIPVRVEILKEGQTAEEMGNVELIFALGSEALLQARARNPDIPIVAGMILQKEDIENLPHTTGVYLEHPAETQLVWMRRILPNARRVGVVYSRAENPECIASAKGIMAQLGFQLVAQEVSNPRELPGALENLANTADVLWGISDDVVLTQQTARQILLFSFRNRIPFVGLSHAWTKAGALYSLDRDYHDLGRQCGELAYRILRGERAGSIAPVAPRKVTYSVNLKTARRMKLDISPSVIQGAEQVY